jgi:hypothetical protein
VVQFDFEPLWQAGIHCERKEKYFKVQGNEFNITRLPMHRDGWKLRI